jgi:Uma2 family endonuclease
MSVIAPYGLNHFQLPPFPVRRFTVDEYHQMIEKGVLTENDPVELLEGWIVPKMPRKPPHDVTIGLIQAALGPRLPSGWHIRGQSALTLDDSEPEPDIAVVRGSLRTYVDRHPGPDETALVIEAADSSLAHDRVAKGRLFARAGIAIYWVVNLVDSRIEVFSDPSGPDSNPQYRQQKFYHRGELVPLVMEGKEVAAVPVDDLLP